MADPVTASVYVAAPPERVYEHFTSPIAMTAWMGQWADLDPVVAGRFAVDIDGVAVRGRYLELDPPHRLVLSWGHAGSEHLPPGASTVEVKFTPEANGTRVDIRHRDLPDPEASRHPAGWRRFLGRLAQLLDTAGDGGQPAQASKLPGPIPTPAVEIP